MASKKIAVQYDDFDEDYEVIRKLRGGVYQELAKFKDKGEAFEYANQKAKKEKLGNVVNGIDDDEDE